MPNIRTLNKDKYDISKHRFLELYHFCLQYPECKNDLKVLTDTVKGIEYSEKVKGGGGENQTEKLAIKRLELRNKCELIEQAAIEADPDLYPYIIAGVTRGLTYRSLREREHMPCGRNVYYDRRRRFFWILSRKK